MVPAKRRSFAFVRERYRTRVQCVGFARVASQQLRTVGPPDGLELVLEPAAAACATSGARGTLILVVGLPHVVHVTKLVPKAEWMRRRQCGRHCEPWATALHAVHNGMAGSQTISPSS